MKGKSVFVILSLLFVFWLSASQSWAQTLYLGVQDIYLFLAESAHTVHVEKGKIIRVSPTPSGLQVLGLKKGQSHLQIDDKRFLFVVLPSAVLAQFKKAQTLLKNITSLQVEIRDSQVFVTGHLQSMKHWKMLAQDLSSYVFAVQIPPKLHLQTQLFFSELIKSQKRSPPQFHFDSNPPYVSVGGAKKHPYKQIKKLLQPYGLTTKHIPDEIYIEPTVRIKVIIAELNRNWSRLMGVSWSGSYALPFARSPGSYPDLQATLQAMETEGHAEVLASPTLLCRHGGQASFLAGGEFAVQSTGPYRTNVSWKQHGVLLKLKPQADHSGRMKLDINVEVSLIDVSQKTQNGIPALKTNRVSTQFDLAHSQSVYLSGLIQKTMGQNFKGWPYLRKIPFLGSLFSSKSFQRNETELVIFITPFFLTGDTLNGRVSP